MNRKAINLLIVILFVFGTFGLVGCGGGGGGESSSGLPVQSQVTKVSTLDGYWVRTIPNGLGGNLLAESMDFYDGGIADVRYTGNSSLTKSGTFTISGNVLTCSYRTSDLSGIYTTVKDILAHPTVGTSINETVTFAFIINGATLTLTETNTGSSSVFTKQ